MVKRNRVVIIGATGRMGAAVARRCAVSHDVTAWKRSDLDVSDLSAIEPKLRSVDFDCLIYTAGVTDVDGCEIHPAEAIVTNTAAPRELARVCKEKGARFIHVSTDYVFAGDEPGPRKESDPAHPINVYGRTKREGEMAVLEISPESLVLRVSWLFGPDRPSFPDRIIERALSSAHVEAISDKWSCPTYSEDLADWIEPMTTDHRYSGILHLSNTGVCSWQQYGQAVLDIAASLGLPLRTRVVGGVSRIGFPAFKAERPAHTALDTGRFQSLSGIQPRHWRDALEDYLKLRFSSRA